jgi:hypothetical protein
MLGRQGAALGTVVVLMRQSQLLEGCGIIWTVKGQGVFAFHQADTIAAYGQEVSTSGSASRTHTEDGADSAP